MDIPELQTHELVIDGCRRLTGPSLVWDETGGILDVLVNGPDLERVLECWYSHIESLLDEVAWDQPKLTHRHFANGYNLLLAAPLDQLYSAVQALETAWYFCACELLKARVESRDALVDALRQQMLQERNSVLLDLERAAAEHGVDFLADDEIVSVGHGCGSRSFPLDNLPAIDDVDWSEIHDVPVALVTGTNGKSTCGRILDGIARAAGHVSGITSTDFVRVGDDVLDRGDYSGPGGARLLLRDARLEVAFLEVARGGILRRGLPLRRARAALVTNIAGDHLGQYGVNTLADMAQTKFAVRGILATDGRLVTNADDAEIVAYIGANPDTRLCWFSLDPANPQIQRHLASGLPCSFCADKRLVHFDGNNLIDICAVDDLPMTLGGAALHNVRNALAAIGMAHAMGYQAPQIASGLMAFHSDARDNPGRMNQFILSNSARVIVDFAHNEHGINAIAGTIERMPAQQKWALFGSAGDRSDEHIAAIARGVCTINPDRVVITELEHYLRGRKPGEVGRIIKQACLQNGISEDAIHLVDSPLEGVRYALSQMQSEDLGLFLVLAQREEIFDLLEQA